MNETSVATDSAELIAQLAVPQSTIVETPCNDIPITNGFPLPLGQEILSAPGVFSNPNQIERRIPFDQEDINDRTGLGISPFSDDGPWRKLRNHGEFFRNDYVALAQSRSNVRKHGVLDTGIEIPDFIRQHLIMRDNYSIEIDYPENITETVYPADSIYVTRGFRTAGATLEASDVIEAAWTLIGVGSGGHDPYTKFNTGPDGVWPDTYVNDNFAPGRLFFNTGEYVLSEPLVFPARVSIFGNGTHHNGQTGTVFVPKETNESLFTGRPVLKTQGSNGANGNHNGNFTTFWQDFSVKTNAWSEVSGIEFGSAQTGKIQRISISTINNATAITILTNGGGRPLNMESMEFEGARPTDDGYAGPVYGVRLQTRARGSIQGCSWHNFDFPIFQNASTSLVVIGCSFENSREKVAVSLTSSSLMLLGAHLKEVRFSDADRTAFDTQGHFYARGVFRSNNGGEQVEWLHDGINRGVFATASGSAELPFYLDTRASEGGAILL